LVLSLAIRQNRQLLLQPVLDQYIMSNWTSGYVADIGYTYGYYRELNPLCARLLLLDKGVHLPQMGAACELGFGQGISINYHAAAGSTRWYGTDFNPSQTAFAQELQRVSGSDAKLLDAGFAEFCADPSLPDFDYIGLHGIWSWISEENRKVLAAFIARKLKVGGLLYVSYNTMPGWSVFAPIRDLMAQHAEVLSARGEGVVSKVNDALGFVEQLLATKPLYARHNPQVTERAAQILQQNRSYLAHEYFNQDWHPMSFGRMAQYMSAAKLQYAGSAAPLEHVDVLNLTPEQQGFLAKIPDAIFREGVRDFMVNQQFRRDYWVKGTRVMTPQEQAELLRAERLVLVTPHSEVVLKVAGALGEAELNAAIYEPLLELLSDHQSKTLGELESALQQRGIQLAQLLQAVMVLSGAGHLAAVQEPEVAEAARRKTEKLNRHVCKLALAAGGISYLASPVTGGGVQVDRFQQIFLHSMHEGRSSSEEWAQYAWQLLSAQDQRLVKEGKTLESAEANQAELLSLARDFAEKRLPILRSLQII
jgi:hypothetical protein